MDPMVWVIFALICLLIVCRIASGRRGLFDLPLCSHEWGAPIDRERLGGEWYTLVKCSKCGKEHWK